MTHPSSVIRFRHAKYLLFEILTCGSPGFSCPTHIVSIIFVFSVAETAVNLFVYLGNTRNMQCKI